MAFSSQLREQVDSMRNEYNALIDKPDPTAEDEEAATKMDGELTALEARLTEAQRLEEQAETRRKSEKTPLRLINTGGEGATAAPTMQVSRKNWSDHFIESSGFKAAMQSGNFQNLRVDVPDAVALKAAGDPIMASQFGTRGTDMTLMGHVFAPVGVIDLIRVETVPASNMRYYQSATFTNAADFIAEGALKPEVQPRWTPVDVPIETIADWTAVTLQALQDIPALRSAIDFDLRSAIEVKVDNVLLNGTGTTPQPRGILQTSGIQNIAFVATTSVPDMIAKGIAAVASGGYGVPNGIVLNPADWWATRVSKAAGSGTYYFGSPTDVGTPNIFGIPVVADGNIAAGTALVGDFRQAVIYQRIGITFIVGLKNDDLIKNLQTIVCEWRLTLAVKRPGAFAKVALV